MASENPTQNMSDLTERKRQILLEDIASRLTQGHNEAKVARELNIPTGALNQLIRSDDFLEILTLVDRNLADGLKAEIEALKHADYQQTILENAADASNCLIDKMKNAKSDGAQIRAAEAVIALAEKMRKRDEGKGGQLDLSKTQLDTLLRTDDELEAQFNPSAS